MMNNLNELFDDPYKIIRFKKFTKYYLDMCCLTEYSFKDTLYSFGSKFLDNQYSGVSNKKFNDFLEQVKNDIIDHCTIIPVGSYLMEVLFDGDKESCYHVFGEDGEHIVEFLMKEDIKDYNGFVEKKWTFIQKSTKE